MLDNAKRDADIVRRYLAGEESIADIGDLYYVSRQRVYQIIDEAGVHRKPLNRINDTEPGAKARLTAKQIDHAIHLHVNHKMSWTNIALLFTNCTRGTVYRLCTNRRPDLRKHHAEEETAAHN